jgi:hypothetical protein
MKKRMKNHNSKYKNNHKKQQKFYKKFIEGKDDT